jgi:hypothetical protein
MADVQEMPTFDSEVKRLHAKIIEVMQGVDARLRHNMKCDPHYKSSILTPAFKMRYPALHDALLLKQDPNSVVMPFFNIVRECAQAGGDTTLDQCDLFVLLAAAAEEFGHYVFTHNETSVLIARFNGWKLEKQADGAVAWVRSDE